MKIVLFTMDRAGKLLIERLVASLPYDVELSLVVTRENRAHDIPGNPVVLTCSEFGVPVIQPSFKDNAHIESIDRIQPDFIFVSNFHKIIKADVRGLAKKGAFNVHSSLLPKLRGATAVGWALLQNLRETGVTLHVLTPGIDDGAIVSQKRIPLSIWDTQGSLYDAVAFAKHDLISDFFEQKRYLNEEKFHKQNEAEASYLPKLNDEDAQVLMEFEVEEMYHKIRAFDPWPGAYIVLPGGIKVRLRKAVLVRKYIKPIHTSKYIILSEQKGNGHASILIRSVSEAIGQPNAYDYELAKNILNYWIENHE